MRIAFIVHRQIRFRNRLIRNIQRQLKEYQCLFFVTNDETRGDELAKKALAEGAKYLIAVGGDGTVHEVVNGIMKSEGVNSRDIILGVLPRGTGNDFSRMLGKRFPLSALRKAIKNEEYSSIDVARISFTENDGQTRSVYFNNIADIGLGGVVVDLVNKRGKTFGGTISFLLATIEAFFKFRHQKVKISSESVNWEGEIMCLSMANGRYFGSGIGIAPYSEWNDGFIDLVIVGKISVLDFIRQLPRLRKALPINHPEVFYHRVQSCRIEKLNNDFCPLEVDGELYGQPMIETEVIPSVINILKSGM